MTAKVACFTLSLLAISASACLAQSESIMIDRPSVNFDLTGASSTTIDVTYTMVTAGQIEVTCEDPNSGIPANKSTVSVPAGSGATKKDITVNCPVPAPMSTISILITVKLLDSQGDPIEQGGMEITAFVNGFSSTS